MVSLARRSSSGAWIRQRRGEKWRTGIFFAAVVGKAGRTASSCLPRSLLPLPSVLILSVRLLPLQIPKGSQLLDRAGDAAFPGRKISGGRAWRGLQVPPGSPEQGGRVAESFGEGSGGRGGWGGRLEGLCPLPSIRIQQPKSRAEPLGASLPPRASAGSFPGSVPDAGSGTKTDPLPAGAPALPRANKANHWRLMKKHLLN